jgi:Flp pilus assembly protein TadG
MKSKPIRFIRDTRGQSLVEFALILPMMLVVMFMVTEFGRALYTYNVLATAARAAARAAVVSGSTTAVSNGTFVANDLLTKARLNTGSTVAIAIDNNYNGSGVKVVTATVTRPFNWAITGPIHVNPAAGSQTVSPTSGLVLKGEAIMKAETF